MSSSAPVAPATIEVTTRVHARVDWRGVARVTRTLTLRPLAGPVPIANHALRWRLRQRDIRLGSIVDRPIGDPIVTVTTEGGRTLVTAWPGIAELSAPYELVVEYQHPGYCWSISGSATIFGDVEIEVADVPPSVLSRQEVDYVLELPRTARSWRSLFGPLHREVLFTNGTERQGVGGTRLIEWQIALEPHEPPRELMFHFARVPLVKPIGLLGGLLGAVLTWGATTALNAYRPNIVRSAIEVLQALQVPTPAGR